MGSGGLVIVIFLDLEMTNKNHMRVLCEHSPLLDLHLLPSNHVAKQRVTIGNHITIGNTTISNHVLNLNAEKGLYQI